MGAGGSLHQQAVTANRTSGLQEWGGDGDQRKAKPLSQILA